MSGDIRLLIVDDVATDCELVARAVRQVIPAAQIVAVGERDAWGRALDDGPYDVILTDYWLTWATGIEVLTTVRGRGFTCPVIIVTGTGDEHVAVEAIKAGVTDYVVKGPVGFTRLPYAIQAALLHHEEREQLAAADTRNRELLEELRASKAFTDQLLSTTPDLVYVNDLSTKRNTYVNPRLQQTLGYGAAEIEAMRPDLLATVLHPDDARRFSEVQLPKILAAGDDDTFVNLFRMKHRSGEWRWFRSHERVFSRTPSGTPTQLVGTAHDITAERENGRALALATTAVTAAANGIVVTDVNATIVWANPAFCRMTGYRHDEVVGLKASVLKSGLQDEAFYRDLWQTILGGRVWRGQLTNRRRDGSQYVEAMTITPVAVDGDRITHFVAVKSDVTREQQMEQRLRVSERMEAVGQLASGVAHDFNNMVTVVLGYCTLLLDQLLDTDPRRADVAAIMSANERAASLTRQLLAFSRKQPLAPKSVDLNALLADARALLKRLLRGDIELDVVLSPAPVLAHVDSVQLEHAIVNLVVNARDAIAGGGRVVVRTGTMTVDDERAAEQPGARAGTYAFVQVSDTGSGMSKEVEKRIFEPFFTTKAQGKGTGLGLATVYGFAKQSNGFIWVNSRLGLGTTFTLLLPLGAQAEAGSREQQPSVASPATATPKNAGNRVVLVVDDDPVLSPLVCRILEEGGFEVLSALTPADAILLYEESRGAPDIVVTDVIMPQMSGPDLAAQLRRRGYWVPCSSCPAMPTPATTGSPARSKTAASSRSPSRLAPSSTASSTFSVPVPGAQ